MLVLDALDNSHLALYITTDEINKVASQNKDTLGNVLQILLYNELGHRKKGSH